MGKKKKKNKTKVIYKDAPKRTARESFLKQTPELTPEQKKEATSRLVTLFKKLGEKPEPILDMFERLEIPYLRRNFAFDDQSEECTYILIKVDDLHAGEIRNQAAGSIVNRLYGDKVAQQTPSETTEYDPKFVEPEEFKEPLKNWQEMPPNTHNPETGEKLPEPEVIEPEVIEPEVTEPADWEKEFLQKGHQPTLSTPDPEEAEEYLRRIQG